MAFRRFLLRLLCFAILPACMVLAAGTTVSLAGGQGLVGGVKALRSSSSAVVPIYWDHRGRWVPGRPPVEVRAFRSCKRFAIRLYRKRTGRRVRLHDVKEFVRYEKNRFALRGVVRIFGHGKKKFRAFHCRTKGARVVWFR